MKNEIEGMSNDRRMNIDEVRRTKKGHKNKNEVKYVWSEEENITEKETVTRDEDEDSRIEEEKVRRYEIGIEWRQLHLRHEEERKEDRVDTSSEEYERRSQHDVKRCEWVNKKNTIEDIYNEGRMNIDGVRRPKKGHKNKDRVNYVWNEEENITKKETRTHTHIGGEKIKMNSSISAVHFIEGMQ